MQTHVLFYLPVVIFLPPASTNTFPGRQGLPRAPGMDTGELFSALSHILCLKGLLPFLLGCLEDKYLPGGIHFYFHDVAVTKV